MRSEIAKNNCFDNEIFQLNFWGKEIFKKNAVILLNISLQHHYF